MNYSDFDKKYNSEELAKQVSEYEANGGKSGDFEKVPYGIYEVKVTKCELKESKKGDPMIAIAFKVLSGICKDRMIYFNQVITRDFQFHIVNNLLRSFDTGLDDKIHFESYRQYGQLMLDIAEAIETQKLEYALEYSEEKGYDTFQINEVFDGGDAPF